MEQPSYRTGRLLSLPNELLIDIINLTRPKGFENFCLSCRTIYTLAHSTGIIAEHKTLQTNFRRVGYLLAEDSSRELADGDLAYTHPVTILNEISKVPFAALYIEKFSLAGLKCTSADQIERSKAEKKDLRDSGRLRDLLHKSPYLKEAKLDPERWHNIITAEVDEGYAQHAYVFLLTLLPNLTRLQLVDQWQEYAYYRDGETTSRETTDILRLICQRSQTPNYGALAKLSTLENGVDEDIGYRLDFTSHFLLLPSIRAFTGTGYRADSRVDPGSGPFEWPPGSAICPLEEINIEDATVSATDMATFLSAMPNLRYLRWDAESCGLDANIGGEGGHFVAAIMASPAKYSLETLLIDQYTYGPSSAVSSLRGFSRLAHIGLSMDMLRSEPHELDAAPNVVDGTSSPDQDETIHSLVDILPASVVDVVIYGRPCFPGEDYRSGSVSAIGDQSNHIPVDKVLAGLPSEPEGLPLLQSVSVTRRLCLGDSKAESLWIRGKGPMPRRTEGLTAD